MPNSGLASKARLAASCESMTLTSCTMSYTSFSLWRIHSETPGVTTLVHSDTLPHSAKQGKIHHFPRSPWSSSIIKPTSLHLTKLYVYFTDKRHALPAIATVTSQDIRKHLCVHRKATASIRSNISLEKAKTTENITNLPCNEIRMNLCLNKISHWPTLISDKHAKTNLV
uniref:Uncharacterized protein n=1 Tax=Glossina pallidipes TaxID=7398 RepID=A0A1A9ZAT1_GLOPL